MAGPTVTTDKPPVPFTPELMRRVLIGTINRYFAQPGKTDEPVTDEQLAAVGAAGTAFVELTRLITEEQERRELLALKEQIDRVEKQLLLILSAASKSVA